MIVYLVELLPALKTTGAIQTLRFSSASQWTRANGVNWLPRLSVPYKRVIQVFDGAFSDQPQDYGTIEVRLQTGDPVSPVIGMAWDGRRARVWRGAPGLNVEAMELVYDGECDSVEATRQGFKVNLRGPGYVLSKNMLALYDGSGDANGTADLANTPKPMLLGTAVDVPPVYVDKARGIFQYHAYGTGAMSGVFDGGSPLTWDGNNYADYATLKAASIAGGYYTTCNALGMGRHGGSSITNLAVDASGLASGGRIGDIITALAGLAGMSVDTATMTWFNSNLAHPQDNFISDQTTYEAVLRDMMLKLGGYICYTADAKLSAGLVRRGGAATITLGRQNLASVSVGKTAPPYYRRRMGYQRAWKVHSLTDVRTPKEINPRGTYAAATAYAYYDLVTYNNDTWLHIGEATTTGTAPVEGAVWTKFTSNITKTSQLTDDAGLGLTALWPNIGDSTGKKPKDYADQTSVSTAAGITGQGAFATKDSAAYGSSLLTGFGPLSPLSNIWFGSGYLLESNGGPQAGLNAFKTILGIAASFTGQGAFATVNSAAYGSSLLTGFGTLASLANLAFGSSYLLESNGGPSASLSGFKTILGTAAAFTGQGPFATQAGGVSLDNGTLFSMPARIAYSADYPEYLSSAAIAFSAASGGYTLQFLRPQESGANTTETRTAAAFTGQGPFATQAGGVSLDNGTLFSMPGRLANNPDYAGYLTAEAVAFRSSSGGNTIQNLRPQEPGSNVTESRSSAGFTGQGSFATLSNLNRNNVSSYLNFNALSFNYSITRSDGVSVVTESLAITTLGISAGFTGQGTLATLNQADTNQIAAGAVTGFTGGTFAISAVNAGETVDCDQRIGFTTTGGRLRVEFSADSVRSGTGTNIGYMLIMVQQPNGNIISVGRQVKASAVTDGAPVYYVTSVVLAAGSYNFFVRMSVGTGKGSNTWSVQSGELNVWESKR